MAGPAALLWAGSAWVEGRWREAVLLEAGADGHWAAVRPDTPPPPAATRLPGPVLPGLVNAHSHAFQRAFAGLAERRAGVHDDFWSWRDRMYGVALAITTEELRELATRLYRELLAGGYTHVCEFHYLHHAPGGERHADPAAMSLALVQAATDAGIGLTLLPVLYERAGFAAPGLRADQRRFAADAGFVLELREHVRQAATAARAARAAGAVGSGGTLAEGAGRISAGVAIHSLRAASATSMRALLDRLAGDAGPIHIHVAEQTGEVDDCLAATGARPIEWLAREGLVDSRWQLVHATHAEPREIDAVAASGAGIVVCPTTEANLGDGVPDLPRWLAAGVPLAIGSDSQVCRSAAEELRWLDYAQRLVHRRRNVAADPARHEGSTAARLFEACAAGGAGAAGFTRWGLQRGAPADALVLDATAPGIAGVPASHRLDAWVFATDAPAIAQTWVAGRRVR
ncbi:MAG: formimidoylglutamate deiminase [Burkholderiales bacterium]|nr:formimidoylglutamate deiminase [Burkholderiales bacterium]